MIFFSLATPVIKFNGLFDCLHKKLSLWQLPVQPMKKNMSKWHLHFSLGDFFPISIEVLCKIVPWNGLSVLRMGPPTCIGLISPEAVADHIGYGLLTRGAIPPTVYELLIETSWKFYSLSNWFELSNQVTNLRMSRQLSCRDMRKIVPWIDQYDSWKTTYILVRFGLWAHKLFV